MAPRRIRPEDIALHLPDEGLVWLHACSGESELVRIGLENPARNIAGLSFTGIFVPGLNRLDYVLAGGGGFLTFFMTPELAAAPERVRFLPLCYRDIRSYFHRRPPDAALFMVSPPDADGNCSFGPVVDFVADIWRRTPIKIAHVNPRVPATRGDGGIPFDAIDFFFEGEQELPESDPGSDETSRRIAAFAAAIVPEGATLQAGLGRVPEAVLRGLTGHRNLSIHSGLIGDSALTLLEAGALREGPSIAAGVAIGTRRLYDAVGSEAFHFHPPSYTHDIRRLSAIPNLVTINSAVEVDLAGQAYAEATPKSLISGPGGASDFAAGARGLDGIRIVALPATAGKGTISRIVPAGKATGPVSLGRFDIDFVVTEHGAADLRMKSHAERAAALVAIAAPEHREALESQYRG